MAHLPSNPFPSLTLPSTSGTPVSPSTLSGLSILFPTSSERTTTSFRSAADRLLSNGVSHVFGVAAASSSPSAQQQVKESLGLPFQLLSDEKGELKQALGGFEGTLAVEDGVVVQVWEGEGAGAEELLGWLEGRVGREGLSTRAEADMLENMTGR
ncbi:hypothetical protein WHR41_00281 [Cladosporium halotolerans]|uniref:Alkyl hydroperoxide reductase subunit C/ Thiol specific antioxidant domain-containing protein n=1 Tax=Cladosporium halotolerans TaxID=1052096 RepID=A0AB34L194_9PEZI